MGNWRPWIESCRCNALIVERDGRLLNSAGRSIGGDGDRAAGPAAERAAEVAALEGKPGAA
jgi:hypothetical protein